MMRLPQGGRRLDRGATLRFTFDGRPMTGHPGDTLASALMASGRRIVGRSFKYHRPRGIVGSGVEEPNALVGLGEGAHHEPNVRATTVELHDGLVAVSQNRWPSLERDVGAVNSVFARFLPAGFYYKTFLWPRPFWAHVYEPLIRRSAGLGRPPTEPDPDRYEHFHAHVDVVIAGGGVAGLRAALVAASSGAHVLLAEQTPHWGGRAPVDGVEIDGRPAGAWVDAAVERLGAMPNVTLRTRSMVAAVQDHGHVLIDERLTRPGGPRHRLWRVRARQVIGATGAIERPLAFAGNDLPGVMLASAMRDFLADQAVAPGRRVVVVANNDDAYRTALALATAGVEVPAVVDARPDPSGPLVERARAAGLDVRAGRGLAAEGRRGVRRVRVFDAAGTGEGGERLECDAVAMSGGWSPVVHLWSQPGGKLAWDAARGAFVPDPARAPIGADGEPLMAMGGTAGGAFGTTDALATATEAARAACSRLGLSVAGAEAPEAAEEPEGPMAPVWLMPARAKPAIREKAFLDFQNDVKVSDIELAAREGFQSVEHAKRYTTLGMATDQGKLSNVNGLAILSDALGQPIPQTGTTTFRPPYAPVPMGAIAGEARGDLFQPIRRTPLHDWHEAQGAHWEPVGHWRRPYCYPRAGEGHEEAVAREVLNTRERLGLLDASTLGKILVQGPDAGRFLDMIYTGAMSTLKPGRCRYGLICSENGFLIDDGVVARLSDDAWLCHTTTGGADAIHGHMEEWLQTEWWDWRVHTLNLTEHYAQIGVVGPHARRALEGLGGTDVTNEALPFMGWAEGRLAGLPVRVFRISFSGELSYEVAVPAGQARALWDRLLEVGEPLGAMPYGTEALHVMRAEKGYVMIGEETDGTVIPQDLGLDWAISRRKNDYIGKRAQARPHMTDPARRRLVGLEAEGGAVIPEGAYVAGEGLNALGQRATIGRVTSTYRSPTLRRGVAMALVERGPERMGETVSVPRLKGPDLTARIVSPVAYDPEGERARA